MFQFLAMPQAGCRRWIPRHLLHRIASPAAIVITAIVAGLIDTQTVNAESSERPNIVLILADDLGFSDIGCFGSEIPTPNIDRLAAEGLRFSQFYDCSVCVPTRASLLTGLYPHQAGRALAAEAGWISAGIDQSSDGLPPHEGHYRAESYGRSEPGVPGGLAADCVTLAEALRHAGYVTLMSGKWHCGEDEPSWPVNRGFLRYFGLLEGAANYFDPTKDYIKPRTLMLDRDVYRVPEDGFYMTDAFTDYAVKFLEQHGRSDKPFFLYLPYTAPHCPLHALPEDIARIKGAFSQGWDELRRRRYRRLQEDEIISASCSLSPRDEAVNAWRLCELLHQSEKQQRRMEVYAAQVYSMDRGIGRVLNKLQELGASENTLVVFLSDNGAYGGELDSDLGELDSTLPPGGENSYESYGRGWANLGNTPFRLYKTWLHEGGIATPVVMRWPRGIRQRGKVVHDVAHVMDFMPTFLDLAGAEYPRMRGDKKAPPLQGKSLAPLLNGKAREGHEYLCWENFGHRAVRRGKWKLVSKYRQWELYDLERDRTEMHNLAAAHPQKVQELARLYDQWARQVGAGVPPADGP